MEDPLLLQDLAHETRWIQPQQASAGTPVRRTRTETKTVNQNDSISNNLKYSKLIISWETAFFSGMPPLQCIESSHHDLCTCEWWGLKIYGCSSWWGQSSTAWLPWMCSTQSSVSGTCGQSVSSRNIGERNLEWQDNWVFPDLSKMFYWWSKPIGNPLLVHDVKQLYPSFGGLKKTQFCSFASKRIPLARSKVTRCWNLRWWCTNVEPGFSMIGTPPQAMQSRTINMHLQDERIGKVLEVAISLLLAQFWTPKPQIYTD